MDPGEENIYLRIFESLRCSLSEKPAHINDISERMSQMGLTKDYNQIIRRIRSPPSIDQAELLETLQYAQEMAQYGIDTSMIDRTKRTPPQNLRAFIIHMQTKTLKLISEQLLSSERVLRKAIEGQQPFTHQSESPERSIMAISKHLAGFANKISNNIYSIQKVQITKPNTETAQISKNSELRVELQKMMAKNLELNGKIAQLQGESTKLLDVNKNLLSNQRALTESLQRVLHKQQQNRSQIQQFKIQIKQLISLYESQKTKWKAHLSQLWSHRLHPSAEAQQGLQEVQQWQGQNSDL